MALLLDLENDYLLADLADALMELAKVTFLQAQITYNGKHETTDLRAASRARRAVVDESQSLLNEAIRYFEHSNRLNPTDHVCLGSWALGLADLADIHVYMGESSWR